MTPLPSAAVSVMLLLYVFAARVLELMVTVNVAVPPLAIEAGPVMVAQPVLPASKEGVMVTFPEQLPVTPTVKLAPGDAGSEPALAVKLNEVGDGICSVHWGETVRVIETCVVPTVLPVTLSSAVIVTLPV